MKALILGIFVYFILRGMLEFLLKFRTIVNKKKLGIWDLLISMIIMTIANNKIRNSESIPQHIFWIITVIAISNLLSAMVQLYKYIIRNDASK